MRQLRSLALGYPSGRVVPQHDHSWSQLLYAASGVAMVTTETGIFGVPPHRALWVPAGAAHSIRAVSFVSLRTLYFQPGLWGRAPQACQVFQVGPFLSALIQRCVELGPLEDALPRHGHLIDVLLDELEQMETDSLHLPWPQDSRAREIAERLDDSPHDERTLSALVQGVGASRRTIERLFLAQTNMTFGQWRTQLRLLRAVGGLGEGRAVTEVALEVGYDSPSAFIEAFKRAFGVTPGRYRATSKELA